MTTTTANITMTERQLQEIVNAAVAAALQATGTAKPETESKVEAKAEPKTKAEPKPKAKPRHDPILDTKRVERMTEKAIGRLSKEGFECKSRKQGSWVWVYPTDGRGRTEEFKAAKLAKGWKHSMKRGAYYRDFSQA